MKELHLIVKGRVQGVFFRKYTIDTAKVMGVLGWVRNTSDGNVEILAQGNEELLNLFLEKVQQGSSASRVDDIVETWQEPQKTFSEFFHNKIH